jgi:predicted nucleic acid-binding protein
MRVYLDTSVILRVLLGDAQRTPEWGKWTHAFSSRLWKTEALRTVDRVRLGGKIDDLQVASLRRDIELVDDALHIVPVTEVILARTGESFPTVVGTLDAIHLASALAVRDSGGLDRLLTHDTQQAIAARSLGLRVDGV